MESDSEKIRDSSWYFKVTLDNMQTMLEAVHLHQTKEDLNRSFFCFIHLEARAVLFIGTKRIVLIWLTEHIEALSGMLIWAYDSGYCSQSRPAL